MVWESCDRIIGDVPAGTLPLDRLHAIDDSFRQHAYSVRAEVNMSVDQTDSKSAGKGGPVRRHLPAGLSQLNLNAAGIDVGATSHFVAVPANCQRRRRWRRVAC